MKKLFVLMAVAVLMLAASCDSKNPGDWPPVLGPSNVQITTPTGMVGLADATWNVTWTGANGPFTVVWNFGGGADPNTVTTSENGNTAQTTVNMLNATAADANYTVTVTITDTNARSGDATASYTVGVIPNQVPVIADATFDATTDVLTVSVTDADDSETLDITVTVPEGMTVDAATKTAAQTGPLTATFQLGAEDPIAGVTGPVSITVTDGTSTSDPTSVNATIDGFNPAADTIYAIPLVNTATTTDQPTILVITGVPANPFQYLVGANVTFPEWVTYVRNSFNVGALGGERADPDGYWGPDGMDVSSMLLGPDDFIWEQEKDMTTEGVADVAGRVRLEFSISPLSGSDMTTASGELFNFNVQFGQTGTATFGFINAVGAIDRTYYRDSTNSDYYWGTLMAGPDGVLNVTGVNNEIVVN